MMEMFLDYINNNYWILLVLFFIFLIWNLFLNIKLTKLKKRVNRLTRGSQMTNLEQVIQDYTREIEFMKDNIKNNTDQINIMTKKTANMKGKLGILRYNAFGEAGNDLSYSIAFLDENKNGAVISSIYNRGESSTYAKPINNGTSTYKLSQEELIVIEKAMK